MISAQQALARLQEGNRRFVAGSHGGTERTNPARREELAAGQAPFATVLGCSDSRVPPEVLFDQGLGDLFVIRVAGNLVSSHETGSVEFAVAALNTPLVVVLGHSNCGVITSAVDALSQGGTDQPEALRSLVAGAKPAVDSVLAAGADDDRAALIDKGVRANVRNSLAQLCHQSELLRRRVQQGDLRIVGAEYYLDSGEVEFFDADRDVD